jgi:amidase
MAATVTISSGATWQEVAADRQKHRDATLSIIEPPLPSIAENEVQLNAIPLASQFLTPEEIMITETTVEDLLPQLAKGALSSVAVTKAFLRRAGLAQKAVRGPPSRLLSVSLTTSQTNCITELLPQRALERAASLDAYLVEHKKPIGPLHGLPISVKEHIGMKDLDQNAGFVSWVGRVAEKDAHILEILWRAGAVFYVRSTQPQSLMHLETSSNLYGYVLLGKGRGWRDFVLIWMQGHDESFQYDTHLWRFFWWRGRSTWVSRKLFGDWYGYWGVDS